MIYRTEHNLRFITEIPSGEAGVIQCKVPLAVELLRLRAGRRTWKTENIEPRDSLPLFIYSPYTMRYWSRTLRSDHDMSLYVRYLREGNLYIHFNEIWRDIVSEEREREGMGYYDYNRIRALIIMDEILDKKKNQDDIKTKKLSIQSEINKIKSKYHV